MLARCLLRSGQIDEAEDIINNLPANSENNQDFVSVKSEVEVFKNAKNNPISNEQEAELKRDIDKNPKNHQIRLDLAKLLLAKGENENAINELLKIIEFDPQWNDGEARKQLIEIFNILGNEDVLVIEGRKKLSSMLFS
jgi:putative thioredoxin